jgi:hypothetical protein
MSFAGMLVQDVSLLHPGVMVDRYGASVPDWNNPTTTPLKAWISQRGRSEDTAAGRRAYIGDWVCYLFPEASPTAGDRIVWDGPTFEVDGPPLPAYVPRGGVPSLHHWELTIKLVEG